MDGTGRTLAAQRLRSRCWSRRRSGLNSLRRRSGRRCRFHNTRRRPDRSIRALSLGSLAARHNNACDSSACNQTELNVHHRFPLFASSANFRLTHHNFMINRLLLPPRRTAQATSNNGIVRNASGTAALSPHFMRDRHRNKRQLALTHNGA